MKNKKKWIKVEKTHFLIGDSAKYAQPKSLSVLEFIAGGTGPVKKIFARFHYMPSENKSG